MEERAYVKLQQQRRIERAQPVEPVMSLEDLAQQAARAAAFLASMDDSAAAENPQPDPPAAPTPTPSSPSVVMGVASNNNSRKRSA